MSAVSHTNRLFNESGCLSIEALERYADSMLSEDELALVEKHISGCPLCKDALDGVHLFHDSSHDLDSRTNDINIKLRQRFGYFPGRQKAAARGPKLRIFLIPAAASIIIMFGIISYFHYFFPENDELAMVVTEDTPEVNREKDAATIGGVMKYDGKAGPEASAESRIDKKAIVEEKREAVESVEDEDIIDIQGELVSVEPDDEISKAEPEVLDEAVTIAPLEDMAGAGVEKDEKFAASRAKSGQKAMAETNEILIVVDQGPMFPGGQDSLNSFLEKNIIYPLVFDNSGDTSVIVQFTVNKKGRLNDIIIIQSAGKEYDDEVLRVFKLMPDWIPGVKDGHNESMMHALSISIPLQP